MKKEVTYKIIVSGNILELMSIIRPKPGQQKGIKRKNLDIKKDNFSKRDDNVRRASSNLRRLIRSNSDLITFITLTFAKNLKDIKIANKFFQSFIKKMKKIYPDFKYIAVPEFQKRGAVHYHLLCNINDYLPNKSLAKIWNHGFVNIKKVKNSKIDTYLSKYLTKDIDNRLFGHRLYLYSQNCIKPLIARTIDLYFRIRASLNLKLLCQNDYIINDCTELSYEMYELPDHLTMDKIRQKMIE
jgi:hypothetical protein